MEALESEFDTSASARVLVVGDSDAEAQSLAAALDGFGLDALGVTLSASAGSNAGVRRVDAILFNRLNVTPAALSRLASELKERARPRPLVLAAISGRLDPAEPPPGVDAVLAPPAHPAQVAARLRLMLRLAVMEDEARLRADTLAARGVAVSLGLDNPPRAKVNVLYVGDASPTFLGLASALSELGSTVSAAFTTFTAFDFLHERDFDAVVVNAMDKVDTAYTICTALRRNTRLFHTPAALLLDHDSFDATDTAFEKGVSELLPIEASSTDLARRVMSLARERQRRILIKSAFAQVRSPEVIDLVSGLATSGFFFDHLDAMARHAHRLERALSVVVARANTPETAQPAERDLALRQIGSMMARLIRAEDFAAELEPGVFAIAMPAARRAAAEGAAHRIAAIAECTAFGGGPAAEAFQAELRCEVGELAREESARGLMARTIKAFERGAAFNDTAQNATG